MYLYCRNVNDAFAKMLSIITELPRGETSLLYTERDTRNGPVLKLDEPLFMAYTHPWERVLFNPIRHCNIFFHLAEAIWMLCGRDDLATLTHYNKRMADFSDDGVRLYGAYGKRWKHWFTDHAWNEDYVDQIELAIEKLRLNPDTRRVVIGMWDPSSDLEGPNVPDEPKDIPCNTHIYLSIENKKLDMTVCNRSNDILWGMLGANFFHFTILQEYMAELLDIPMGRFYQFTNNAHLYIDIWTHGQLREMLAWEEVHNNDYPVRDDDKSLLFDHSGSEERITSEFIEQANYLLSNDPRFEGSGWLADVVQPILRAWNYHKERDYLLARNSANRCYQEDYRTAAIEWLNRTEAHWIKQNPYQELSHE